MESYSASNKAKSLTNNELDFLKLKNDSVTNKSLNDS